jgi:hypothetical protein
MRGKVLSDSEIAGWAKSAGFPPEEIATAVAVALAESSGRIDAIGDGGKSFGLWQIYQPAHPNLMNDSVQWWSAANASMAYQVWRERKATGQNGWAAWTMYKNGTYLLYMLRGRLAASFPSSPGTVDPGTTKTNTVLDTPAALAEIGNAVKGVAQGFFKAGAWLGESGNIIRAAQVAVGGAMVVGALVIVVRPAVTGAASVLPVGKIAKAVT